MQGILSRLLPLADFEYVVWEGHGQKENPDLHKAVIRLGSLMYCPQRCPCLSKRITLAKHQVCQYYSGTAAFAFKAMNQYFTSFLINHIHKLTSSLKKHCYILLVHIFYCIMLILEEIWKVTNICREQFRRAKAQYVRDSQMLQCVNWPANQWVSSQPYWYTDVLTLSLFADFLIQITSSSITNLNLWRCSELPRQILPKGLQTKCCSTSTWFCSQKSLDLFQSCSDHIKCHKDRGNFSSRFSLANILCTTYGERKSLQSLLTNTVKWKTVEGSSKINC